MSPKIKKLKPQETAPYKVDGSDIHFRLAKAILLARQSQGYSQARLSHMSGVSIRTIQRLEAGTLGASLVTVLHVCRALGISIDKLAKIGGAK